jgi:predicted small secreted protein
MAKGSAVGNLLPLLVVVILLAIIAVVGFVVYSIAHDVGHQTRRKLEKRNISFTKDGARVGIKEVTQEQQGDQAQKYAVGIAEIRENANTRYSVLIKMWNQAKFPAYKSKLGWMDGNKDASPSASPLPTPGTEKRKPCVCYSDSTSPADSTGSLDHRPARLVCHERTPTPTSRELPQGHRVQTKMFA